MNIYLVGYRCTGKTTLGKALADRLNWDFVDTDHRVEKQAGMDIATLVARWGWADFRRREKRVLQRLAGLERQVVATGGGIVIDRANVELMRQSGRVLWLRASAAVITSRMAADPASINQRPALTGLNHEAEIVRTLELRQSLYEAAAHWQIETGQTGIEKLCRKIVEHIERTDHGQ